MHYREWENHFEDHILQRGYDYFTEGLAESLYLTGTTLCASVYGTKRYDVRITFAGDRVKDMTCSCPYAEGGRACKHMAAVLYQWDENSDVYADDLPGGVSPAGNASADLMESASEETVRAFLKQVLQENETYRARFKLFVKSDMSQSDVKHYKQRVDQIVYRHMGRERFITYDRAGDFSRELSNLLDDEVYLMIENGQCAVAFEITNYIFQMIGTVDMDDSGGESGFIGDQCMTLWREMILAADDRTQDHMLDWFTGHLDGSVVDYMEDYIEQILMTEFFEPDQLQKKLDFTEKKYREAIADRKNDWNASYNAGKWAGYHVLVMEDLYVDPGEIEAYCRDKWKYHSVREYYIEWCIEQKEFDKAIDALRECIEMDKNAAGWIAQDRNQLKDLYKLLGRQAEYREALWEIVLQGNSVKNMDEYHELKDLYDPEEWEIQREKVFALSAWRLGLGILYKEEKLYDRLYQYVMQSGDLGAVMAYADVLKEDHPVEILELYEKNVMQMAEYTANRKEYRRWVEILREIQNLDIPGCEECVQRIVRKWRISYSNRRAMMDELDRM